MARRALLVALLIAIVAPSCAPRRSVQWTIDGTDASLRGVANPPASYGFAVVEHDEDGFCFVSRPLEDPVGAVDAMFERYSIQMADLGWRVQGAARPPEAGRAYHELCQFLPRRSPRQRVRLVRHV